MKKAKKNFAVPLPEKDGRTNEELYEAVEAIADKIDDEKQAGQIRELLERFEGLARQVAKPQTSNEGKLKVWLNGRGYWVTKEQFAAINPGGNQRTMTEAQALEFIGEA